MEGTSLAFFFNRSEHRKQEFLPLGANSLKKKKEKISKRLVSGKTNRKSQKLFFFVKMMEKHKDVPFYLNPIAPREAKIAYNFGLSECNRVNTEIRSDAFYWW